MDSPRSSREHIEEYGGSKRVAVQGPLSTAAGRADMQEHLAVMAEQLRAMEEQHQQLFSGRRPDRENLAKATARYWQGVSAGTGARTSDTTNNELTNSVAALLQKCPSSPPGRMADPAGRQQHLSCYSSSNSPRSTHTSATQLSRSRRSVTADPVVLLPHASAPAAATSASGAPLNCQHSLNAIQQAVLQAPPTAPQHTFGGVQQAASTSDVASQHVTPSVDLQLTEDPSQNAGHNTVAAAAAAVTTTAGAGATELDASASCQSAEQLQQQQGSQTADGVATADTPPVLQNIVKAEPSPAAAAAGNGSAAENGTSAAGTDGIAHINAGTVDGDSDPSTQGVVRGVAMKLLQEAAEAAQKQQLHQADANSLQTASQQAGACTVAGRTCVGEKGIADCSRSPQNTAGVGSTCDVVQPLAQEDGRQAKSHTAAAPADSSKLASASANSSDQAGPPSDSSSTGVAMASAGVTDQMVPSAEGNASVAAAAEVADVAAMPSKVKDEGAAQAQANSYVGESADGAHKVAASDDGSHEAAPASAPHTAHTHMDGMQLPTEPGVQTEQRGQAGALAVVCNQERAVVASSSRVAVEELAMATVTWPVACSAPSSPRAAVALGKRQASAGIPGEVRVFKYPRARAAKYSSSDDESGNEDGAGDQGRGTGDGGWAWGGAVTHLGQDTEPLPSAFSTHGVLPGQQHSTGQQRAADQQESGAESQEEEEKEDEVLKDMSPHQPQDSEEGESRKHPLTPGQDEPVPEDTQSVLGLSAAVPARKQPTLRAGASVPEQRETDPGQDDTEAGPGKNDSAAGSAQSDNETCPGKANSAAGPVHNERHVSSSGGGSVLPEPSFYPSQRHSTDSFSSDDWHPAGDALRAATAGAAGSTRPEGRNAGIDSITLDPGVRSGVRPVETRTSSGTPFSNTQANAGPHGPLNAPHAAHQTPVFEGHQQAHSLPTSGDLNSNGSGSTAEVQLGSPVSKGAGSPPDAGEGSVAGDTQVGTPSTRQMRSVGSGIDIDSVLLGSPLPYSLYAQSQHPQSSHQSTPQHQQQGHPFSTTTSSPTSTVKLVGPTGQQPPNQPGYSSATTTPTTTAHHTQPPEAPPSTSHFVISQASHVPAYLPQPRVLLYEPGRYTDSPGPDTPQHAARTSPAPAQFTTPGALLGDERRQLLSMPAQHVDESAISPGQRMREAYEPHPSPESPSISQPRRSPTTASEPELRSPITWQAGQPTPSRSHASPDAWQGGAASRLPFSQPPQLPSHTNTLGVTSAIAPSVGVTSVTRVNALSLLPLGLASSAAAAGSAIHMQAGTVPSSSTATVTAAAARSAYSGMHTGQAAQGTVPNSSHLATGLTAGQVPTDGTSMAKSASGNVIVGAAAAPAMALSQQLPGLSPDSQFLSDLNATQIAIRAAIQAAQAERLSVEAQLMHAQLDTASDSTPPPAVSNSHAASQLDSTLQASANKHSTDRQQGHAAQGTQPIQPAKQAMSPVSADKLAALKQRRQQQKQEQHQDQFTPTPNTGQRAALSSAMTTPASTERVARTSSEGKGYAKPGGGGGGLGSVAGSGGGPRGSSTPGGGSKSGSTPRRRRASHADVGRSSAGSYSSRATSSFSPVPIELGSPRPTTRAVSMSGIPQQPAHITRISNGASPYTQIPRGSSVGGAAPLAIPRGSGGVSALCQNTPTAIPRPIGVLGTPSTQQTPHPLQPALPNMLSAAHNTPPVQAPSKISAASTLTPGAELDQRLSGMLAAWEAYKAHVSAWQGTSSGPSAAAAPPAVLRLPSQGMELGHGAAGLSSTFSPGELQAALQASSATITQHAGTVQQPGSNVQGAVLQQADSHLQNGAVQTPIGTLPHVVSQPRGSHVQGSGSRSSPPYSSTIHELADLAPGSRVSATDGSPNQSPIVPPLQLSMLQPQLQPMSSPTGGMSQPRTSPTGSTAQPASPHAADLAQSLFSPTGSTAQPAYTSWPALGADSARKAGDSSSGHQAATPLRRKNTAEDVPIVTGGWAGSSVTADTPTSARRTGKGAYSARASSSPQIGAGPRNPATAGSAPKPQHSLPSPLPPGSATNRLGSGPASASATRQQQQQQQQQGISKAYGDVNLTTAQSAGPRTQQSDQGEVGSNSAPPTKSLALLRLKRQCIMRHNLQPSQPTGAAPTEAAETADVAEQGSDQDKGHSGYNIRPQRLSALQGLAAARGRSSAAQSSNSWPVSPHQSSQKPQETTAGTPAVGQTGDGDGSHGQQDTEGEVQGEGTAKPFLKRKSQRVVIPNKLDWSHVRSRTVTRMPDYIPPQAGPVGINHRTPPRRPLTSPAMHTHGASRPGTAASHRSHVSGRSVPAASNRASSGAVGKRRPSVQQQQRQSAASAYPSSYLSIDDAWTPVKKSAKHTATAADRPASHKSRSVTPDLGYDMERYTGVSHIRHHTGGNHGRDSLRTGNSTRALPQPVSGQQGRAGITSMAPTVIGQSNGSPHSPQAAPRQPITPSSPLDDLLAHVNTLLRDFDARFSG